jgi:hypothetical protein
MATPDNSYIRVPKISTIKWLIEDSNGHDLNNVSVTVERALAKISI